jgi:hypothetical protein
MYLSNVNRCLSKGYVGRKTAPTMKLPKDIQDRAYKYGKTTRGLVDRSAVTLQRMKGEALNLMQQHRITSEPKAEVSRPPPSKTDSETAGLQSAIDKVSGRDKVGLVAEYGAAAGGAAVGLAASGTVASLAGASTFLGSTALASALGGIFAVATPIGWMVGTAVLTGTAAYAVAKLARSGAMQDVLRRDLIHRLSERLKSHASANANSSDGYEELNQLIAVCIASELVTEEDAHRIVSKVEQNSMPLDLALQRLRDMAIEAGAIRTANDT